jgi:hypothetical protein
MRVPELRRVADPIHRDQHARCLIDRLDYQAKRRVVSVDAKCTANVSVIQQVLRVRVFFDNLLDLTLLVFFLVFNRPRCLMF